MPAAAVVEVAAVAGADFPVPVAHEWDRSVTVEDPAAAARAIHGRSRVARISGVRQRVALVIGVLPALTAEANGRMPKLRVAQSGRIHGIHVQPIARIPEEKSELTGRIHALAVKQIDRILAVIDRVIEVIVVMIGRIPEVIGGKRARIAGRTAAIIMMVTI
jgi:hypothetical protein